MIDSQKNFRFPAPKNTHKACFGNGLQLFLINFIFLAQCLSPIIKKWAKTPLALPPILPILPFSPILGTPQRQKMSESMSDVRKFCGHLLTVFGDFPDHKSSIKYPLTTF